MARFVVVLTEIKIQRIVNKIMKTVFILIFIMLAI